MGFIDYQGTKEDRYNDVLEFAKAQQEEEARRIETQKVSKWLKESLKDSRYVELSVNDLMKYVIVRYRKLAELKTELLKVTSEKNIDAELLWKDFCISLVTRHLDPFYLPEDKQLTYYTTFMEKVFRLEDFTIAERHRYNLSENYAYKRYFADCFEMVQEKQFWKWIGQIGSRDAVKRDAFIDIYEQLSVLLGYYLYLGIQPANTEWMQRIQIEQKALEKIRIDYKKGRFKEPNYRKLQNPLYKPIKVMPQDTGGKTSENTDQDGFQASTSFQEHIVADPVRQKRPQMDKDKFNDLLSHHRLLSYVDACRLLRNCKLPKEMDEIYQTLILRMPVLQESIDKFEEVYQPDMYSFYEYYIPEALQLTATYLEYLDVGIGEKILGETEKEVLDAGSKLVIAINDKIDEIYKFASIEIKAKAKALESIMSQDGYVNPDFKIK